MEFLDYALNQSVVQSASITLRNINESKYSGRLSRDAAGAASPHTAVALMVRKR